MLFPPSSCRVTRLLVAVASADEGHGFIKKENNIRAYRTALEFLDKHVNAAPRASGN